jgi:hypothetical protein
LQAKPGRESFPESESGFIDELAGNHSRPMAKKYSSKAAPDEFRQPDKGHRNTGYELVRHPVTL